MIYFSVHYQIVDSEFVVWRQLVVLHFRDCLRSFCCTSLRRFTAFCGEFKLLLSCIDADGQVGLWPVSHSSSLSRLCWRSVLRSCAHFGGMTSRHPGTRGKLFLAYVCGGRFVSGHGNSDYNAVGFPTLRPFTPTLLRWVVWTLAPSAIKPRRSVKLSLTSALTCCW